MKDNRGIIVYVIICVIILALSIASAYWIATSDLPDWLKFWLLK